MHLYFIFFFYLYAFLFKILKISNMYGKYDILLFLLHVLCTYNRIVSVISIIFVDLNILTEEYIKSINKHQIDYLENIKSTFSRFISWKHHPKIVLSSFQYISSIFVWLLTGLTTAVVIDLENDENGGIKKTQLLYTSQNNFNRLG